MARKYRFWTYVCDADGDMIEDVAENNDLGSAISDGVIWMQEQPPEYFENYTIHVVDYELEYGTTVWVAGPGNAITPAPALTPDAGDHHVGIGQ